MGDFHQRSKPSPSYIGLTVAPLGHKPLASPPSPPGSTSTALPGPPVASLSRLPQKRVLTINMDVPEPWLIEPVQVWP